jgi:release factor glutamine methyltransferase
MTVQSCITKNSTIPFQDLELILAWVLKRDRGYVLAHFDYTISAIQKLRLKYALFVYNYGWSIAHITHHKEFFGLDFYVNRHTLIPRPDTEKLVEEALTILETTAQNSKVTVIDIGTGSGCIPVAIGKKSPRPLTMYATDISRGALKVAKRNAKNHAVPITFFRGNLLKPLFSELQKHQQDEPMIITANLPYLTDEQFRSEPSIRREPYNALVAKEQGLALYRNLLTQIKEALKDKRCNLHLIFEIDPSQGELASKLVSTYFPEARVALAQDLGNRPRVVIAHLSPTLFNG